MTEKSSAKRTEYKFVGLHVDDLADGRILEPGQLVKLTDSEAADPHNQQRINDGLLLDTTRKERA